MDVYIYLLTVLFIAGLATIVRFFGGEGLIAGYNTASAEEKAYMKEKGIGKFVGNYMYGLAAIILTGFLLEKAGVRYAQDIAWAVFAVVIVIMLIRIRRFNYPGTRNSPQARRSLRLTLLILVIVAVLITWTAFPAGVDLQSDQFVISGVYGVSCRYSDIEQVQLILIEELPDINLRTNGLSLGPINKGHFQLEDGGSVLLYLRNRKPPFIHITFKSEQKPIILNYADPTLTTELFEELYAKVD